MKPVRDSMAEALQLWKKSTGEDATSEDPKGDYFSVAGANYGLKFEV